LLKAFSLSSLSPHQLSTQTSKPFVQVGFEAAAEKQVTELSAWSGSDLAIASNRGNILLLFF